MSVFVCVKNILFNKKMNEYIIIYGIPLNEFLVKIN